MCALSNPCDIVAISFLQINCQSLSLGKEICPRLGTAKSNFRAATRFLLDGVGRKSCGGTFVSESDQGSLGGTAASFPWLMVCAGPTLGSKNPQYPQGTRDGAAGTDEAEAQTGMLEETTGVCRHSTGKRVDPRGAWRRSHVERGPGTGGGPGAEKGRCPCGDRLSTFSI